MWPPVAAGGPPSSVPQFAVSVSVADCAAGAVTVRVSDAVSEFVPSVPVMMAVPALTPVATPLAGYTVATAVFDDVYAIEPALGSTVPVPFGPVHSWNNEFAVPPIAMFAGKFLPPMF
jgi:hypothetical protein